LAATRTVSGPPIGSFWKTAGSRVIVTKMRVVWAALDNYKTSDSCPEVIAAGVQCLTSAFGWKPPLKMATATFAETKMAVFWVVAPCSLVDFYQTIRPPGATTQKIAIFVLTAVRTSSPTFAETLVTTKQSTRLSPESRSYTQNIRLFTPCRATPHLL
jgi:hypothetical protein